MLSQRRLGEDLIMREGSADGMQPLRVQNLIGDDKSDPREGLKVGAPKRLLRTFHW